MKNNIVDNFLYKLLFLTLILAFGVFLERISIINLEKIKTILSENINITKVVEQVNGELNIIDLGDDIVKVDNDDKLIEVLNENYYIYKQKNNKVLSQSIGSVIKIEHKNELYSVTILDKNDNILIYSDLRNINVKMYQILKINDVIGECSSLNNNNYNYYFKLQINEN